MSAPSLQIVHKNKRRFVEKHTFENYKRALANLPLLERDPQAPIVLVPFRQAYEDLGVCERTLERWIAPNGAEADQAA